MNDDAERFSDTAPSRLAELMSPREVSGADWSSGELAAMLRHQLAARLEDDLGPAAGGSSQTFRDLLTDPRPSLDRLEIARRYARSRCDDPDGPLPRALATWLYFASIAAALDGHGACRTRLDDDALRDGLTWAREQDWTGGMLCGRFDAALTRVGEGAGSGERRSLIDR
ncbi:MAG: hypothetical protein CMJ18_21200 [Phycisphaeraceae bacterium]|nr:hypothetical protein [Phycisphaeraceae bacterium]